MPYAEVRQPLVGPEAFHGDSDAAAQSQAAILLLIGRQLRGDDAPETLSEEDRQRFPVPQFAYTGERFDPETLRAGLAQRSGVRFACVSISSSWPTVVGSASSIPKSTSRFCRSGSTTLPHTTRTSGSDTTCPLHYKHIDCNDFGQGNAEDATVELAGTARLFAQHTFWRATGAPSAGRALVHALSSEDEGLRTIAGMFLAKSGKRAEPLLREALWRRQNVPLILTILGDIGDHEIEPDLRQFSQDSDPRVAQAARDALRVLVMCRSMEH